MGVCRGLLSEPFVESQNIAGIGPLIQELAELSELSGEWAMGWFAFKTPVTM